MRLLCFGRETTDVLRIVPTIFVGNLLHDFGPAFVLVPQLKEVFLLNLEKSPLLTEASQCAFVSLL